MVAGQENLPDTDENKLVRESEERSVLIPVLYACIDKVFVERKAKFYFECHVCLSAGPGLTTDWSLATATALEAPTRMRRVSRLGFNENECEKLNTHTRSPLGVTAVCYLDRAVGNRFLLSVHNVRHLNLRPLC